ncbi:hypothetical protein [Rubellimicrobium aerolatum]|uniref:DUF1515 domain-containing protein n=1 Tax=Rubellimicrobium aerolatum TaxID=490979 RepID=A0ABW0SEY7_9RHOB|nr:hypothetical protein [Rubellimicrobium aerolatum]MBP1806487.1 roadblock/LC7 domain-containing protein [Rubellimicrobium aerolatum]
METRLAVVEVKLAAVETRLEAIDTRMRAVEASLATLTERVAHLPSKGFIVTSTMTTLAVVAAFGLFADRLRALLGL